MPTSIVRWSSTGSRTTQPSWNRTARLLLASSSTTTDRKNHLYSYGLYSYGLYSYRLEVLLA